MSKIIKLQQELIAFDDGSTITSDHNQDCCERHYLDAGSIDLDEVKDLEFDLTQPLEQLIERVEDYGIRLKATNNFALAIPAYGYNNGYYGTNIDLTLKTADKEETIDISECQNIRD